MTFRHLRLVKRQLLAEYQVNKFARRMLEGQLYQPKPPPQHPQWVLYHSWKVGVVELDEEDAMILRSLMGGSTDIDSEARRLELVEELREIGLCEDEPIDLNELVDSNPFHAIQNSYELRQFLSIAKEVEPRVVVEIGTARGGTFYCLSQIARPDATLISIDLPGAANCGGQTDGERELFLSFGPSSQDFHFLPADSHLPSTKSALGKILGGRSIDVLFIDGDHSKEGVRKDFEMYREFVAPDGIVAFHDILLFEDNCGGAAGVGDFWATISGCYQTQEIVDPDGILNPRGTSLPQANKWGIGVIENPRAQVEIP